MVAPVPWKNKVRVVLLFPSTLMKSPLNVRPAGSVIVLLIALTALAAWHLTGLRPQRDIFIQGRLTLAREQPGLVAPLVRLFARERDDAVIAAHIRAYVGDLSLDMGQAGRTALAALAQMA